MVVIELKLLWGKGLKEQDKVWKKKKKKKEKQNNVKNGEKPDRNAGNLIDESYLFIFNWEK